MQDSSTLDSLDMDELTYMMKEGEMIDENLTLHRLNQIFVEANSGAEEEGVDDDEDELVYEEFVEVLTMICDAKVPEEQRVQALVPLAGLNLPASHMTQAPDEPRTKPSIPQIGQHSLGSTETETDVHLVCKKEGLQTGKDLSVF